MTTHEHNPHHPDNPITPIISLVNTTIMKYRELAKAHSLSTTPSNPNELSLYYADKANQLLAAKRAMLELWEGKE
jgi:hypothetical protein